MQQQLNIKIMYVMHKHTWINCSHCIMTNWMRQSSIYHLLFYITSMRYKWIHSISIKTTSLECQCIIDSTRRQLRSLHQFNLYEHLRIMNIWDMESFHHSLTAFRERGKKMNENRTSSFICLRSDSDSDRRHHSSTAHHRR